MQELKFESLVQRDKLGNTILMKLKLWEIVIVFNKTFWSATNVFCNLGTSKTVINIRHQGKYCYPIYFPIWLPQQCSRWTKKLEHKKMVEDKYVLIPF